MSKQYGYKVYYKEQNQRYFVRHVVVSTLSDAATVLDWYMKYPFERKTGQRLNNPKWRIKPITKKDIKAGLWKGVPFSLYQEKNYK